MAVWFEGSSEIECDIEHVKHALENLGECFVGVTSRIPGMTSVALEGQGPGFVNIRTNEGLMKRTGILKRTETERVVVQFDEEYEAGSKVTTKSHFMDEFKASGKGVMHRIVIGDVHASGFLGFLYRYFGSSKMGNAFLKSYKTYFEA